MPTVKQAHSKLVNAIITYLREVRHIPAWKNNTGAVRIPGQKGRRPSFVRFSHPGAADVFAIIPPNGLFCGIEAKTGSGRLTKDQQEFKLEIESVGGLYIEAHNLDDVHDAIRRVHKCQKTTQLFPDQR